MSESTTCKADYYERVSDNARSIVEHTAAMPGDSDVYEAVNEAADGAVIYYTDCDEILRFTNNRDAAFEQMGPECIAGKESTSEINTVLAYFAYSQDLSEAPHNMDEDEAHELAGHHQCEECDEWHEDKSEAEDCCKTEYVCHDGEDDGGIGDATFETDTGCGHEWKAYHHEYMDKNFKCPECGATTIEEA